MQAVVALEGFVVHVLLRGRSDLMLPEAVVELIGGSASLAVRVVRLRPLDYGLNIPGLKVLNKEVLVLQLVLEVALCRGIVIVFATDIHLVLTRVTDVSLEIRAQTHILP